MQCLGLAGRDRENEGNEGERYLKRYFERRQSKQETSKKEENVEEKEEGKVRGWVLVSQPYTFVNHSVCLTGTELNKCSSVEGRNEGCGRYVTLAQGALILK